MYYKINVAKATGKTWAEGYPYEHLFATDKRSCMSHSSAKKVLKELKAVFPNPAYNISIIKWEEEGIGVDADELLNS